MAYNPQNIVGAAGTQTATSGTVVFSNSNGVTFGMSNSSVITASASLSQSNQQLSVYAASNTTNATSMTANASSLAFGGYGIVSVGASNGTVQISASQSKANVSLYALGNTTQNSSTVLNESNLSFNAIGNLSVGFSNGSIQISDQTNQTMTIYAVSNTTESSSMTANASNLSFAGAGVASVGASNGSVVVSVPAGGGSLNISAGTTSNNLTNVTFSNANGVSFGLNASTVTASVASQSNQQISAYVVSNTVTANANTSGTLNASNLSFQGVGNASVGVSNGSVVISASGGAGGGGVAVAASNTTFTSGTVVMSNNGGALTIGSGAQSVLFSVPATSSLSATGIVSLSTNGSTISIGANNVWSFSASGNTTQNTTVTANATNLILQGQGIASVGFTSNSLNISALAPSIQAGTQTATSGTAVFSNSNNFSFGMSNSSVVTASYSQSNQQMSLYAVSNTTESTAATANASNLSFAGAGGISVGASNSSIVISSPSSETLSRWAEPDDNFTSVGLSGQGSLSIQRVWVPFYVSGSAALIAASISASTNTGATTASVNNSLWMGIYTNNGSTLSLASSGSAANNFVVSQSGSTSANSSVNFLRQLTVPMNINVTPGEYWVGAVLSQATTYTGIAITMYGGSLINSANAGAALTPIGFNITAGRPVYQMQGIYTAGTSAGPVSINTNAVNGTSAGFVGRANVYIQLYNATY